MHVHVNDSLNLERIESTLSSRSRMHEPFSSYRHHKGHHKASKRFFSFLFNFSFLFSFSIFFKSNRVDDCGSKLPPILVVIFTYSKVVDQVDSGPTNWARIKPAYQVSFFECRSKFAARMRKVFRVFLIN